MRTPIISIIFVFASDGFTEMSDCGGYTSLHPPRADEIRKITSDGETVVSLSSKNAKLNENRGK